jgi:hypothetical protein
VSFTATPITPLLGTRVESDKATLLGGAHAGEMCALLEQRGARDGGGLAQL